MTTIPSYQAHPVPQHLRPYLERILALDVTSDQTFVIPARPTGHVYFGWIPIGHADAKANGTAFSLRAGQTHLSGQLSTFDCEYTLRGPIRHFLAECTATGAHSMTGRDIATLLNQCEVSDRPDAPSADLAGFITLLDQFAAKATPPDAKITDAAARISAQNGDIAMTQLARDLGMSDRHFRRAFAKVVGISPKPYAMIKRVLYALQMLAQNPDAQAADIVFDAGFYDQAHMTKVFQLYLRSTPRDLQLDADGVLQSIVIGA